MRPLEKIINEYLESCIKGEDAQERGDSKMYNKQQRIIQKIRKELKSNSEYGLEKLMPFLEHQSTFVRLETAISLVPVQPERAKQVLLELIDTRGLTAFNAKMTLSEWKNGNLKFDF
ncbi:HEAT repeat protein [Sporomusaceae bacterium BoRhaA]|uniref:DUF2019 domain-containing protein n=1 Tax=Pelorhabdus rhamnosifermentans TaxID=2772457 RepID=UPI001C060B47|nr:DUF2019 domain-containing protein [Pelorhabdus rhamnosifermentans]MBU2703248.1 HEAT repeat protein [Pelorhabdus rhamnosifermentans]